MDVPPILTALTNLLSSVQILENIMKRKEANYTWKSMSDDTNEEKIYKEIENIEDLVKRKEISDMSGTTTLDQTRLAIVNGNWGLGGGRVI